MSVSSFRTRMRVVVGAAVRHQRVLFSTCRDFPVLGLRYRQRLQGKRTSSVLNASLPFMAPLTGLPGSDVSSLTSDMLILL